MKQFLKTFSLDNLKQNLKNTIFRFPVVIIIILLTASLFFVQLHYHDNISDYYNIRILIAILSLIMTFIFSISVYLSTENSNKTKLQRNLFQIIPIVFWIFFYNIFSLNPNDFENFLFFGLSFTWIIAYLFFAPYLKNLINKSNIKQSVYYSYFFNISTTILISFIFAWVLFWLWAIAITAIDTLFDLNIKEEFTYWNWAILSLSIISPIFALTQIPNKNNFLKNNFNENAFFSFLIKFVAIPFIYLYFFILYTYSIKVLSNFSEWPRWEVSWLVIWFSIFGYLTYIFSYIFEEKNKLIKNFRKIFPYAVIPQVFMLFYAIYLRINQYDITVNRYFVVVFGLWLLVTSLYFIFSKKKNLIAIPSLLALFIIIISIIPKYNVYSLPEARQLARLEINLKKAWILQDNKIVPLKNYSDISEDLSKNIYSWIDYLCDFNNCESIKNLFPKIYEEIYNNDKKDWEKNIKEEIAILEKNKDKKECKYNSFWYANNFDCYDKKQLEKLKKEDFKGPNKWQIVSWITKKIKVKSYFNLDEYNKKYLEYRIINDESIFPIELNWYSKIYEIYSFDKWDKHYNYAEYDINKETITIKENFKKDITISTKEISEQLLKKFGKNDKWYLSKEDLTFNLENWKYKLYFIEISILNPDYNKKDFNYWYTRWYLLVK